jgi:hypothetical protein
VLVFLQYGLAMTVADCVFMAVIVRLGGFRDAAPRLVVTATILVLGVTSGVLADRADNPRRSAFLSGVLLTGVYLALDTAATAAFLVDGWGVPANW